jgi:flagellar basal-body rod modification protein FlgD
MATTPIGSTGGSNSTSNVPSTVKNKMGELKSEDFIKMMITQLQNQDPMEPAKNDQLLSQMSQISQLQSSTDLTSSLKNMVLQNNIGSAGNLIGKTVQGKDAAGEDVTGLVNSVKVDKDGVSLELDNGRTLAMANITQISPATAKKAA